MENICISRRKNKPFFGFSNPYLFFLRLVFYEKEQKICRPTDVGRTAALYSPSGSAVAFQQFDQLGFANHAGLRPQSAPVFVDHERGHAPDAELGSQRLIFVHVNFQDSGLVADLSGHLFEYGRHGPAGTAPRGIKVQQDGFFALDDFFEYHVGLFFLGKKWKK
jgi:hypothetical protein